MTQEEIILLFKDLSCRVPYTPKINISGYYDRSYNFDEDLFEVLIDATVLIDGGIMYVNDRQIGVEDYHDTVKPYLRPMSSMTMEETREFLSIGNDDAAGNLLNFTKQDWLNANHFDYRGLIPMNLALEAPEGMYKNNKNGHDTGRKIVDV